MTLCIVCPVSTMLARTYTTWMTGRGPQKPFTIKATINYPEETLMYPFLGSLSKVIVKFMIKILFSGRLEKVMFLLLMCNYCTKVVKNVYFISFVRNYVLACTIENMTKYRYILCIVLNAVTLCLHYVPALVIRSF